MISALVAFMDGWYLVLVSMQFLLCILFNFSANRLQDVMTGHWLVTPYHLDLQEIEIFVHCDQQGQSGL